MSRVVLALQDTTKGTVILFPISTLRNVPIFLINNDTAFPSIPT